MSGVISEPKVNKGIQVTVKRKKALNKSVQSVFTSLTLTTKPADGFTDAAEHEDSSADQCQFGPMSDAQT